jgi:hypothetical protein
MIGDVRAYAMNIGLYDEVVIMYNAWMRLE